MKRLVVLFTLALAFHAHAEPGKPVLYRDTWGVPHVYADTLSDAAYALGYAQAEDRLDDIYKNIRTAIGRMAEAFGEEHVETDYALRMIRNAELCEEYWKVAPDYVRDACDSFMRGVEAFLAEHPEKKPDFAVELHGWQCAAVGRTMILQWPLGTLMDDLGNKDKVPGFGSNAFAVSPARSADGSAILMTDPHLTWEGMAVFYEARVHYPGVDQSGFYLAGTPIPALGHNGHVAWACTTGGPDTSDVYMLKLNPKNVAQYEYNGQWRTFEPKLIEINVKGKDMPELKPALYTVYGPLLDIPDEKKGVAYAGATPYMNEAGVFEQMYKMATARNCDEFYQALGMNQMMEQNLLFADTQGNIQYVRTGRTPIRPEGYDWSMPVQGGIGKSEWLGIHGIEDLVQVKNPPQGYFQNCNVSPAVMMKDSPLTPDKYRPYIYNVSWDHNSPRGARLLELLDADPSVTKEEAMDYTLNIYDILSKPWQNALKAAIDAVGAAKMADAEFAKCANDILQWDGHFSVDTTIAAVYKFWRLKCENEIDLAALVEGRALSQDHQVKLLDNLSATMAELKQKYGRVDVRWGEINLIGRGGKYFGSPGADFGGGPGKRNQTETVMDVSTHEEEKGSGKYVAFNGTAFVMLSFLRPDGIESYSLTNWGISGDPASPHYVDQSEKLYAQRKFKPTWFKKEDLLKNLESEKTLTVH